MRLFPTLLAACFCVSAFSQSISGAYQCKNHPPQGWNINGHGTVIWDGAMYLPVGLTIGGTVAEVEAAHKAGISDVIVRLPVNGAGWADVVAALEKNAMRYIVQIDGLMPSGKAYIVEPEGYRIAGITEDRNVDVPMPGADIALAIVVTQRDRNIQVTQRVPITSGRFQLPIKMPNSLEQVLLVYPHQVETSHSDYWEIFDQRRDQLLTSLRNANFGPGLRGIVDPIGRSLDQADNDVHYVPDSDYFRTELKNYIANKYKTVAVAARSWSMTSNDIDSFEGLARLIPLWSNRRGVESFWDPSNDRLYSCTSNSTSTVWSDIDSVVASAATRRFQRLASSVQDLVDVPIVQSWSGWRPPCESTDPTLSGIAFDVAGSSTASIQADGSMAGSSMRRWPKTGWLLCSEWDLAGAKKGEVSISDGLEDMAAFGARGWFVNTADPDLIAAVKAEEDKKAADTSYAQWSPLALFFPEEIGNPAAAQRLPGGYFWYPSPNLGVRVDLGSAYNCYRYVAGSNSFIALWRTTGAERARLRFPTAKSAKFVTLDGSDPKPKFFKDGVEITLSDVPLMVTGTDETPVPEAALQETIDRDEALVKYADSIKRDVSEDAYSLQTAKDSVSRDPIGAYTELRATYYRLSRKIGDYTWIEAENSKSTNFSEVEHGDGLSSGGALSLRSQILADPHGFFAEYEAHTRSKDDQEIWIAARIPKSARQDVKLTIGDQHFDITGEPVSAYSNGYAWYKLGDATLDPTSKVTLQVLSTEGGDISVDAILFYPGHFNPHGVTVPDAMNFRAPLKKGKG